MDVIPMKIFFSSIRKISLFIKYTVINDCIYYIMIQGDFFIEKHSLLMFLKIFFLQNFTFTIGRVINELYTLNKYLFKVYISGVVDEHFAEYPYAIFVIYSYDNHRRKLVVVSG